MLRVHPSLGSDSLTFFRLGLGLLSSLEYCSHLGAPQLVAVGGPQSHLARSKQEKRQERKRAEVSVVMFRISELQNEGNWIVFTVGTSKVFEVSRRLVRVGGRGWTDLGSRERSF